MWPYEFFNQYSALINEFNIDNDKVGQQKKKIFVSMWYGEEKDGTKQKQSALYEHFRKAIEEKEIYKVISTKIKDDDKDVDIDFRLKYLLETTIADETRKDDISFDIFRKIVEASLIICDVTPIGEIQAKEKPVFCANVMAELGLSLAWKLPEQVVILFNIKNSFGFSLNELPFNIKGYFVHELDFNNNQNFKTELFNIIERRFKDTDEKKSIFIKNIKSKLDQDSISALARRNGLMFFDQNVDVHTIRYLLSLGIIRTEQFPSKPISFGYCLTEIGKIVLTQLGIQLFPEEFIDFYLVRYWEGYSAEKGYAPHNFEEKQKAFEKAYGIKSWKDGLQTFVKQIPQEVKKVIEDVREVKRGIEERSKEKQNGNSYNLVIFPYFVDSYPFELVNSTVSGWLKLTDNSKEKIN